MLSTILVNSVMFLKLLNCLDGFRLNKLICLGMRSISVSSDSSVSKISLHSLHLNKFTNTLNP
jgi:hypothetical protein